MEVGCTRLLCVLLLSYQMILSAFVGMAVMVTMFPLPGYIASKIQSVQLDKMKKACLNP